MKMTISVRNTVISISGLLIIGFCSVRRSQVDSFIYNPNQTSKFKTACSQVRVAIQCKVSAEWVIFMKISTKLRRGFAVWSTSLCTYYLAYCRTVTNIFRIFDTVKLVPDSLTQHNGSPPMTAAIPEKNASRRMHFSSTFNYFLLTINHNSAIIETLW